MMQDEYRVMLGVHEETSRACQSPCVLLEARCGGRRPSSRADAGLMLCQIHHFIGGKAANRREQTELVHTQAPPLPQSASVEK